MLIIIIPEHRYQSSFRTTYKKMVKNIFYGRIMKIHIFVFYQHYDFSLYLYKIFVCFSTLMITHFVSILSASKRSYVHSNHHLPFTYAINVSYAFRTLSGTSSQIFLLDVNMSFDSFVSLIIFYLLKFQARSLHIISINLLI